MENDKAIEFDIIEGGIREQKEGKVVKVDYKKNETVCYEVEVPQSSGSGSGSGQVLPCRYDDRSCACQCIMYAT